MGNGRTIRIWEDAWIDLKAGQKVTSQKPPACTYNRVEELMNRDKMGWNIPLLRELFREDEVAAIHSTPINVLGSGIS